MSQISQKKRQIFCGVIHTFLLTKEGDVYGFGANYYGQIGLENFASKKEPVIIDYFKSKNIKIKTISTCGYDSFFVSIENEVYCCGYNGNGELGLGNIKICSIVKHPFFINNTSLEDFEIVCGGGSTYILDKKEGKVYSCGYNRYYQLGFDHKNDVSTPTLIPLNEKVVKIFAKATYVFFLTEKKEFYCCGDNSFGKMGKDEKVGGIKLSLFSSLNKIVNVGLGVYESYFLTLDNKMYKSNSKGKFDLVEIPNNEKIIQIKAGENFALILTEKSRVFRIETKNGKFIDESLKYSKFTELKDSVVEIDVGWRHSIALTSSGEVYSVGKNDYGQLGIGNFKDSKTFQKIELNLPCIYDNINKTGESMFFSPKRDLMMVKNEKSVNSSSSVNGSFIISYKNIQINKTEKLGSGGFGIVFKGTMEEYTDVAVKQLHIQNMTEESLEEFEKETQIWVTLRHPNVLLLYGICNEPGHYCMVMELMENGSLFNYIHRKGVKLSWKQRWKIALDMGKGLLHLHNKNIEHRDLKSLNVLLDSQLRAKLADFGLSTVKRETTTATNIGGQVAGTIEWMAPELLMGGKFTKKADIYAYGMILWELATMKIPYKNFLSPTLVINYVMMGNREEIPKDCQPTFRKLIEKCLRAKKDERPSIKDVVSILAKAKSEF